MAAEPPDEDGGDDEPTAAQSCSQLLGAPIFISHEREFAGSVDGGDYRVCFAYRASLSSAIPPTGQPRTPVWIRRRTTRCRCSAGIEVDQQTRPTRNPDPTRPQQRPARPSPPRYPPLSNTTDATSPGSLTTPAV
jgi:hypothetical protein